MERKKIIILVILILAIASFFRLWHLNSVPPGVYPDEAINGNNAIEALKTNEYKIFYPENNGREGLFINLIALSFNIFGVHIWSLKLISALIGILTVLGLYLLAKELLRSPIIALLSAFFLSISFWHVNFSRIAFRAILVPFCLVWSFYFLYKVINAMLIRESHANDTNKKNTLLSIIYLTLSGFFFGLGFHTYIAFRVAVLILIIPLITILLKSRKNFWQYVFWILIIIIVALPIGLYFLNNPQDFLGRAGGVSVFSQENPLKALVLSTIKTLGMFNVAGDWNWRHNFSGSPQLLWPIGIFFLIGLIISVKKAIKSKFGSHCLLITWFAVMLLPAILTYEGLPHALRSIGVIPVSYIFAGIGAYFVYQFLFEFVKLNKLDKALLVLACFLILLGCGYIQYDKYFIDWAKQPAVESAFAKNYVEIGRYLNRLPENIKKYVIVNQSGVLVKGIPMPAQTVMFIENSKFKMQNAKYLLPDEINKIETTNNLVVIPLQYDIEIFRKLKQKFPQGKTRFQENFWLFEIK